MKHVDQLCDQVEAQYPHFVMSIVQGKFIYFFDKNGLPAGTLEIKEVRGSQLVVDLFDYKNKLRHDHASWNL